MSELKNYFSTSQAAKIFPLAESTVTRFCKSGHLPATLVANRWLIHADDIRRFIAEGKVRTPGRKPKKRTNHELIQLL